MNIYERALRTWGIDAQLGMVIEECAELIKVINKHWRGKATKEELIEECVDVDLMIAQMRECFKDDIGTWDTIRMKKIEYLMKLLEP